jgi:hypothetical protein
MIGDGTVDARLHSMQFQHHRQLRGKLLSQDASCACLLLLCRFLLALVDPSPAVRQLAEYLLRDVLAVKAPLLAYNHFVEAIFVLNGCTAGLHGARLGANMGSSGGGASAATSLGQPAEDGGQEGAAGDVLSVAAPAQFTLKGKQHRCVPGRLSTAFFQPSKVAVLCAGPRWVPSGRILSSAEGM